MVRKVSLPIIFDFALNNVRVPGDGSTRILIYCQTWKQCTIIYNMFFLNLQNDTVMELKIIERGGTPHSVKSHISEEISKPESHLRVVICTIAFGMGVNAKNVNERINFGPSITMTIFVQESDRIGRDGGQALVS